MYFDALALAAVAEELREAILGGRVQRALLPSQLSVALEIYAAGRRWHLLLSAHPQFTRAHLSAAKPSRGVERATPLLLLLRKYVVGGRVVAIEQPDLERVLLLSIVKGPQPRNTPADEADEPPEDDEPLAEGETRRCELVVEAMERRGNVILVGDDNLILESLRHIPPRLSRRPVLPREPYELPPRQEKRDPRHATAEGLRALLDGSEPQLARAMVAAYRGLSPLAAREVVFRATGSADTPLAPDLPWARLALALRGLWADAPEPSLARGPTGEPLAFAPYMLTHLPGAAPAESTSAAVEAFYGAHERLSSHQQRRDAVRALLLEARERLLAQRHSLAAELQRAAELDRLRWEGEMIYAFLHSLRPGQAALEVEGRTIALDPQRTPAENAQDRFRAYDKAKGALAGVPERLHEVEARLAGLDETLALLDLAEGFEQIEGIAREAAEQGYLRAAGRPGAKQRRQPPLRVDTPDGYAIYVGRSAGQNEQVTFKIGAADDVWLHARGMPGAHVLIKSAGREVPEPTLRRAAELAAYYSKGRGESAVEIDIARRSQVRRIPNAPAGLVSYHAERTIRAAPRASNEPLP